MHQQLDLLAQDIRKIRQNHTPVAFAWNLACEKVGASSQWLEFGKLFFSHPDLMHSDNKYHNHYHSAEAIISGAYLGKEEFKDMAPYYGPILLFAMMGHDVAHDGGHNTFDYELEKKAVASIKRFVSSDIINFWNQNLSHDYGAWDNFFEVFESIVLNTDFKHGPKENSQNYSYGKSLTQLKMLATEADVLPSCISTLGPERGTMLAIETDNPHLGTWKSRHKFLDKLVIYNSQASIQLQIPQHISAQIKAIESYGIDYLDSLEFNSTVNKIVDKTKEFELSNISNTQKIRPH